MKIRTFLEYHGITANPFADEDARTDLVFKSVCIRNTFHPTWDKIYGDPTDPATAVVFGEKGSGKTAIHLQLAQHLADYNAEHPERQAFVIAYDDFNPFLDCFRERFSGRRRRHVERMLEYWHLWDHIDAILSLGVTQLVDRVLGNRDARHVAARDEQLPLEALDSTQVRDVMLLAACYDQSTAENPFERWRQLAQRLGFSTWPAKWDLGLGVLGTLLVLILFGYYGGLSAFKNIWPYLLTAAVWLPRLWRLLHSAWKAWRISQNTKVLKPRTKLLCRMLLNFPGPRLAGQPLPAAPRSDDRYELLGKLQGVLRALKFNSLLVLVDRVDEPYLINGSTELMRGLIWPLLDNKLLKHPGLGLKLLLPSELERLLDRQDSDFHQRARLDKQNLIRALEWTGQALYDMAHARLAACAVEGRMPRMPDLFEGVEKGRLISAFAALRVPRNLFKFMYRLLTTHCNSYSEEQPKWKIPAATFESVLALYLRDQAAFERGESAG